MQSVLRGLLLNGVNLNLLGRREPEKYGHDTLAIIENRLIQQAEKLNIHLVAYQSNREFELVEAIHQTDAHFAIINPGAFTHTSIALRDAFLGVALPFYEVHLSNVFARETFRHHSYLSDIAVGVIVGMGALGYELALSAAHQQFFKAVH